MDFSDLNCDFLLIRRIGFSNSDAYIDLLDVPLNGASILYLNCVTSNIQQRNGTVLHLVPVLQYLTMFEPLPLVKYAILYLVVVMFQHAIEALAETEGLKFENMYNSSNDELCF